MGLNFSPPSRFRLGSSCVLFIYWVKLISSPSSKWRRQKNAATSERTKRCFGVARISVYRSDQLWLLTSNQAIPRLRVRPETLHQHIAWKSMLLYFDGLSNCTSVKAAVQTQLCSNRSQQWAALPWIRDKRFTVNSKWCFLQPIDHSRPLGFHPRSAAHPSSHSFPDDTL